MLVPVAIREVTADSWGRNFGTVQTKRVVVDTVEKLKMYRDLSAISKEPAIKGSLSLSKEAEDVFGVIVVGESATRNSMSLYGYARETTPRFDGLANELYVFKDVVAPWGNTPMACRFVLTEATLRMPDAAYCTLPQVFLQAGVGSCLISSQGRWGAYGHVGGYIFNSCKEKIYLPEVSKLPIYDSDVLPHLQRQFAVSNQCVFVHLTGSHFPPESTYPKHVVAFKADSKIDHYDNSIRFTDEVLGAIIDMLKTSSRPSYMIYFSDHGETPRAKTWRDSSTRDLWEIPLVVWLSPEYRRRFPNIGDKMRSVLDKPIQTDRIFKLFLSLAQIKGFVGHCCEDDVLAEDFSGHHERIMSVQNR